MDEERSRACECMCHRGDGRDPALCRCRNPNVSTTAYQLVDLIPGFAALGLTSKQRKQFFEAVDHARNTLIR